MKKKQKKQKKQRKKIQKSGDYLHKDFQEKETKIYKFFYKRHFYKQPQAEIG